MIFSCYKKLSSSRNLASCSLYRCLTLGKTGLLKERPATTNNAALTQLRDMGAKIVDARVVDDDDIITAGGITSGIDLGLWIIERFAGSVKATEISHKLEYKRHPKLWRAGKLITPI